MSFIQQQLLCTIAPVITWQKIWIHICILGKSSYSEDRTTAKYDYKTSLAANTSNSKYSSLGTSSRGINFTSGADIEQSKVSDTPSRNSKTTVSKREGQNFEGRQSLIRKSARGGTSSYGVCNFNCLRNNHNSNGRGRKKGLWQSAANFRWMRSSLLASMDVIQFWTT
jgi:hypothetical protein